MQQPSSKSIDWLNIILIIISLGVAFVIPFRLFLIAYALLGPLHYITEINWIKDKNYFVKNRFWIWFAIGLVILIMFPKYILILTDHSGNSGFLSFLSKYSNSFLFVGLSAAIVMIFTNRKNIQLLIIILSFPLAYILNNVPFYIAIVGLLLPTLIHVYFFTLLFMLYGTLKNKSKPGYISVILLASVPLIIIFSKVNPDWYLFSDWVKNNFEIANFHVTNAKIAQFLGMKKGELSFFYYEKIELKLQIFIAFAYTYHYLNWFSKTSIIGWHKALNLRKISFLVLIWIISISLFIYDYKLGFWVLLLLSILHVILEFPINIISIRGIVKSIVK